MGHIMKKIVVGGSFLLAILTCNAGVDFSTLSDAERIKLSQATEVWDPEPGVVEAKTDAPPSDAIVLVGDTGEPRWEPVNEGSSTWPVREGVLTVKPGAGDIRTKDDFCDIQLHLEWKTPTSVAGLEGQQRYNSGIFIQERYEIQILDSYQNRTYANGQAGSLYKQVPPLVNATRPPGEWQTYDIIFTAPRFQGEDLVAKGHVTVLHNGVLVQNHVEIQGTTEWIGPPQVVPHGCAPLRLQDHGNAVSFRNMWVRKL